MKMENMEIYNQIRSVPKEAQKTIKGGRLNGFTDINSMWRIQELTRMFGPCGIGWKYTIEREWMEAGANGEVSAFMDILLYYKFGGIWSEGIPGTGGSSFVAKERNGLYTSDECYKMALTDAISVAAKAIGMGADIYWDKGRSKYDVARNEQPTGPRCSKCGREIMPYKDGTKAYTAKEMAEKSESMFGSPMCSKCVKSEAKRKAQEDSDSAGSEGMMHTNAGDQA